MIWQDIVITVASILFSYALVPQIYQGFKKKKGDIEFQTGLITFIGMYAIAVCYFSLELYYSFTMAFITGTLWLILFLQKVFYR